MLRTNGRKMKSMISNYIKITYVICLLLGNFMKFKKSFYFPEVVRFIFSSMWRLCEVKSAFSLHLPFSLSQRSTLHFQKSFRIFLGHIILSVDPTRWTRVIMSYFNWEIVTARELCQISWLLMHTCRQREDESWKWTPVNASENKNGIGMLTVTVTVTPRKRHTNGRITVR